MHALLFGPLIRYVCFVVYHCSLEVDSVPRIEHDLEIRPRGTDLQLVFSSVAIRLPRNDRGP